MTRRILYLFSLGLMTGLLLFHLFVSLRCFGLYQHVLHYPAQGEDQARENIFMMFVVLIPLLVVLGTGLVWALNWVAAGLGFGGRGSAVAAAVVLALADVYVSYRASQSADANAGILFAITGSFFAYTSILLLVLLGMRRIFRISGTEPVLRS